MKYIIAILLVLSSLYGKAQYNPTLFNNQNNAMGFAQATPADARSMYYDQTATPKVFRDFQNKAEVISYLTLTKNRFGGAPIFIHSGGTLVNGVWIGGVRDIYIFKDSTDINSLVYWNTIQSVNGRTGVVVIGNADSLRNKVVDFSTVYRNNYLLAIDTAANKIFLVPPASGYTAGTGIDITGQVIMALNNSPLWNANQFRSRSISTNSPNVGNVYKWNGVSWVPSPDLSALDTAYLSGYTIYLIGGTDTVTVPIADIVIGNDGYNITGDTTGTIHFTIQQTGTDKRTGIDINVDSTSVYSNTGGHYTQLSAKGDSLKLIYTNNGGLQKTIKLDTSAITVTDNINSFGQKYNADYSTNGKANPRWIPDIAAVRSTVHDSAGNYIKPSDTASMLSHYINAAGYGLTKTGQSLKLDSATVFPQIRATIPIPATITNAIGSGDTLLISNTVKRLNAGYGIINTPSSTNITQKADTATLFPAVRATIPSATTTWPQALANGRTFSANDSALLGTNNFKFRGTDVRDYTSILGNKIIFNISPLTNGQPFITVNPITPEPSQLPFYFGRDTSSSLDPTIANEVMSMGFNLRANNRVISNQAAFGTQYESNWHTGPGDPRRFEYYIVHIDSAGRNNRPMFLVMTEDNKQDFWTYAVQGAGWVSPTNNDSGYAAISRNYNVSNGDQAGDFYLGGAAMRNNFYIHHDFLDSSWTIENQNTLKNNPLQFRDWSGLNPASPEVINFGLATEAWNIGCFKGLNCKRAIFGDYNVGALSPVPLASHCQSTSSSNDNIRVYANDYGSYHFRIDDAGNSFFNNGNVNIGQATIGSHTLTVNGDVQIKTLTNGTAGIDSVVVVNGGVLKKAKSGTVVTTLDHTVFTTTDGGTVNLNNHQYNILNGSGAFTALTVNLPSSPSNGDVVYLKFTTPVATVTYGNGTVVDGIIAPGSGAMVMLVYDSGTTSWY